MLRQILRVALIVTLASICIRDVAVGEVRRMPELNTILMESTFRIHGPKKGQANVISFGTTFLMGKASSDVSLAYYVLVTAAHVLDEIDGDEATLTLRQKNSNGTYSERPWPVKIRDGGKQLYARHAEADVAALYVNMPDDMNVQIIPMGLFADDTILEKFEIHPGDELMCLGFPLFVSSESGFPILRSGKIASYPIVPTKVHKSILFDFRVFNGNSGGPVYIIDRGRTYGGETYLGQTIQFVIGLVTSQMQARLFNNQPLQLAAVIPSSFIRETIDLLPATSPYK